MLVNYNMKFDLNDAAVLQRVISKKKGRHLDIEQDQACSCTKQSAGASQIHC